MKNSKGSHTILDISMYKRAQAFGISHTNSLTLFPSPNGVPLTNGISKNKIVGGLKVVYKVVHEALAPCNFVRIMLRSNFNYSSFFPIIFRKYWIGAFATRVQAKCDRSEESRKKRTHFEALSVSVYARACQITVE